MVVIGPNQNASPEDEQGCFIGGVSTAPSLTFGCTYMRGARYSYEGRVFLTHVYLSTTLTMTTIMAYMVIGNGTAYQLC